MINENRHFNIREDSDFVLEFGRTYYFNFILFLRPSIILIEHHFLEILVISNYDFDLLGELDPLRRR